jgi:hypothetical protein
LPNVKNATSYFENGLKNRFRAIAIRAVHHFPSRKRRSLKKYFLSFWIPKKYYFPPMGISHLGCATNHWKNESKLDF